jgi:NhaA family Na+:H+ antiporter
MSLFIGALAFPGETLLQTEVRIGVIAGSLLSLLAGAAVLQLAALRRSRRDAALAPA